nr:MAG TPA: peptidoglycan recognition protein [Caudoviricetes sp.]
MKLIDLLVQELPKRGGWPNGAVCATQDKDGEVYFSEGETPEFGLVAWHDGDWCGNEFHTITATDYDTAIITRAQYESALAASQKPAWNGEGLPPVGCDCECHVDEGIIHCVVVGYDFDGKAVVMRNVPVRKYFSIQANSGRIRPLRTEKERKRDEAAEAIGFYMPEFITDTPNEFYHAKKIYDAIAAGKIPGVKLED